MFVELTGESMCLRCIIRTGDIFMRLTYLILTQIMEDLTIMCH